MKSWIKQIFYWLSARLEVAPARFVPEDASLIPGMKKVIINLEPTYCDSLFDMVIHQKIGEFARSLGMKK